MWVDVGAWGDARAAPPAGGADAQLSEEHGGDRGSEARRPRDGASRGRRFGDGRSGRRGDTRRLKRLKRFKRLGAFRTFLAQQRSLASVAAARRAARSARVPAEPRLRPRAAGPVDSRRAQVRSRLSNRKLIRNALSHVCLAGAAMRAAREKALQALDDVPPERAATFVIAFRENVAPHRFRALYALVDESGDAAFSRRLVKIHGAAGPASVALSGVESTMKYDSGTREFKPLATSAVGPQTAAVVLSKR